MDLFVTVRRLESRMAQVLEGAAERISRPGVRSPLQVIHAVVDAVEQEVVPAGRGRRVFPYNSIAVQLVAPTQAQRSRYEALVDDRPSLRDRIVERLRGAGADVRHLDVTVAYAPQAGDGWVAADFHAAFARLEPPREAVAVEAPAIDPLEISVLNGTATEPAYTLSLPRIDIGRGVDVRDTSGRLLRTNHVAFTECDDDVNRSVSRRHAHIRCDPVTGEYRIVDDGSAHGTSVLRNGSTIVVRTGARGVRLLDADVIAVGDARLRIRRTRPLA